MLTPNIVLNPQQEDALRKLKLFTTSPNQQVFILRGYAGTGKTTLIREYVKYLEEHKIGYELLASTGRAAKILRDITDKDTKTVHSQIYTFRDFNINLDERYKDYSDIPPRAESDGQLFLQFETTHAESNDIVPHLYIIDEASMISDTADPFPTAAVFGSGRLLSDLMHYDADGRFIFVGDDAQLPPVVGTGMPALSETYFQQVFGKGTASASLTKIMRQGEGSDIVRASKKVREIMKELPTGKWTKLPFAHCSEIIMHNSPAEMFQSYLRQIKKNGYNSATYICRSNQSCYNAASLLRRSMPFSSSGINVGDLLLVTQNNLLSGFMNGDLVEVLQVGQTLYQAELCFVHAELRELASGHTYSQYVITDLLTSARPGLTQSQQKRLYLDFYFRMKREGIKQKSQMFRDELYTDELLNALRCVYGYALTCHKTQGGEWDDVYIDIPNVMSFQISGQSDDNTRIEALQWIYTAITRAKKRVHLVQNWFYD